MNARPVQPVALARPPAPPIVRIEAHYRKFLARRWLALNVRAAILTGLIVSSTVLILSGFRVSSLPWSFLLGLLAFPLGVYPVLGVRRAWIISQAKVPAKTFLPSLFFASFTPRTLQLVGANLLSAALLTSVYSLLLKLYRPAAALQFWAPTPRHPVHWNERFVFLIVGHAALSVFLSARDILHDRIRAVWPQKRVPFSRAVQAAILHRIPSLDQVVIHQWNSFTLALVWSAAYTIGYKLFRRTVWTLLVTHTGGLLRPFIINFTKSKSAVSLSLGFHLLVVQFMTLAILKIPSSAVNAYVTQPLDFDAFTRKSPLGADRYILTALESKNTYYLHFTLMELLRVSHTPARRQAIFSDISQKGSMTSELFQQLLLHLGRQYAQLATRGLPPSTVSAAPPVKLVPDSHSIAVKSGDVFKPIVRSKSGLSVALKTVLDGPIRPAPPAPVLKAQVLSKEISTKAVARIEGSSKEVLGRIEGTPTGHAVVGEAKRFGEAVYTWGGKEWARRRVDAALPEPVVLQRLVEVLANLIEGSVTEDTYGHVQHLTPSVLEAIVRFHSSLLSFESELSAQASLLGYAQAAAQAHAHTRLAQARGSCEDGIRRICGAYGKSMSAFVFPSSIAAALSDICRKDETRPT